LKLNGTLQLLVYVDYDILGGSRHAMKKTTHALVVASKESGPEESADRT
jgi:hypothetical protein